jgi:hypothetical protein
MNKIIDLNNLAIRYLNEGNAFEASTHLARAYCVYLGTTGGVDCRWGIEHKTYSTSWVSFQQNSEDKTHSRGFPPPIIAEKLSLMMHPPILCQCSLSIKKPCCNVAPAKVHGVSTRCQQCNEDDDLICPCSISPIILYNLGLVCQILGIQYGACTNDGMFYLTRSNYMYERVLGICITGHGSTFQATLQATVQNNLACLYHEIGRQDKGRAILENLRYSLRSMSTIFLHPNWRIFCINMDILDGNARSPTAGAA